MERFCPGCQQTLGAHDSYFCSTCGVVLPDSLAQAPNFYMRTHILDKETRTKAVVRTAMLDTVTRIFHMLNFRALLSVFAIVVMLFYVLNIIKTSIKPNLFQSIRNNQAGQSTLSEGAFESEQIVTKTTLKLPIKLKVGAVDTAEFSTYVPYDADFVAEMHDFTKFFGLFVDQDPGYEAFYNDIKPYVEDSFGIYAVSAQTPEFGMVFFGNDQFAKFSSSGKSYLQWLNVEVYGNALLVSTNEDFISDMKDCRNKLEKNLKLNSAYLMANKLHPPVAGAYVYAFGVGGTEVVDFISQKKLSPEFQNMIKVFKDSEQSSVSFVGE